MNQSQHLLQMAIYHQPCCLAARVRRLPLDGCSDCKHPIHSLTQRCRDKRRVRCGTLDYERAFCPSRSNEATLTAKPVSGAHIIRRIADHE